MVKIVAKECQRGAIDWGKGRWRNLTSRHWRPNCVTPTISSRLTIRKLLSFSPMTSFIATPPSRSLWVLERTSRRTAAPGCHWMANRRWRPADTEADYFQNPAGQGILSGHISHWNRGFTSQSVSILARRVPSLRMGVTQHDIQSAETARFGHDASALRDRVASAWVTFDSWQRFPLYRGCSLIM